MRLISRKPSGAVAERLDVSLDPVVLGTSSGSGRTLEVGLGRLNQYRLLAVEEVSYLPIDNAGASLPLHLIASRYQTGSVVVTSNLAFSRLGETLDDDDDAAATIDLLVRHAQVIALDGDSYRTRATAPVHPDRHGAHLVPRGVNY